MAYLSYRLDEAAEASLRRARMLAPRKFEWLYYHAEALQRIGRMSEAAILLEQAVERRPDYYQAATRLGVLHTRLGNLDAARAVLGKVVEAHPDDIESRLALARAHLRAEDFDSAITHLNELVVRHGHIGSVYFGLADAYRRKGDQSKAAPYGRLADRYRAAGFSSADPLLTEVARMNLSDTPLILAAERARQAGNDGRAIGFLLAALERNPQGHLTHATLVGLYGAQKQFDEADEHYRRALELSPPTASLMRNLGLARIHEGRLADARAALEQSLALDDGDARTHAFLGMVNLDQGNTDHGIEALYRALELQPGHPLARRYLVDALRAEGREEEARRLLNR